MRHSLIAFALGLAACGRSAPPVTDSTVGVDSGVIACTADARPGIVVRAVDGSTGEPVAGFVVASYSDSGGVRSIVDSATVSPEQSGPWSTAHERAGVYALRIRRAGYADWDTAGVRVTSDRCHVGTVQIVARLRRVP